MAAVSIGGVVAVVSSAASPRPALAASPGGYITQGTVKARADWWLVNHGAIYSNSQGAAAVAPGGERYRPDCSGFVSMAWHLPKLNNGADLSTGEFWHLSGTFQGGTTVDSVLSHVAIGSLQPGDAIVRHNDNPWSGHIRLFDGWANIQKTRYYAYEEYSPGEDARREVFDTPTSGWRGVRYVRNLSEPTLTVTEYCPYRVTSGTVNKRGGAGVMYTGEGVLVTGATFLASTQSLGVWRRASGGVVPPGVGGGPNLAGGWVSSGDGGSFIRAAGSCTTV
jgi:hypothetical protein